MHKRMEEINDQMNEKNDQMNEKMETMEKQIQVMTQSIPPRVYTESANQLKRLLARQTMKNLTALVIKSSKLSQSEIFEGNVYSLKALHEIGRAPDWYNNAYRTIKFVQQSGDEIAHPSRFTAEEAEDTLRVVLYRDQDVVTLMELLHNYYRENGIEFGQPVSIVDK
eukprot:TRINITY_DN2366_c0_g2_i1.p1 TRINITY_DN2366_c0_g2~~TRINITY_DN2366_c0_g2_i1.p1  ORF type:complete len:167 (+),score=12.40 TRINITY_DN2366_c0_g2_i1:468-968(+)